MATRKTVHSLKVKPLLRGYSHQFAAAVALMAGAALTWFARQTTTLHATAGVFIYSVSLFALFAVSAVYHRVQWSPAARALVRRIDHAAITFLIAGSSTAIGIFTLSSEDLARFMAITWVGASIGIAATLFWIQAPKPVTALLFVLISVAAAPYFPRIGLAMGMFNAWLLVGGGATYILGAVVYGLRRPDPFPRVFGYHEVFHLLVIAAAACHYTVIFRLVRAAS